MTKMRSEAESNYEMRSTGPSYVAHDDAASARSADNVALIPKDSYIWFCIPASWVVLPDNGEEVHIKNSSITTIFLLLNTMIGSGIVVQPYVFARSGIVSAILQYIIVGMLMYSGVELLIRSAEKANNFHYSNLADQVLGKYGRLAVDLSVVVNNIGALLSYILIIGSLASEVVDTITYGDCSEWWCNAGFLTLFPIILFTIPLCLIRNFGHLAIISYISITVIVSIILLVLIGGPIRRVYYDHGDDDKSVKTGSFLGSISTVGDIVFALGYITAIFHAWQGMEVKTVPEFTKVAMSTTILGMIMCFVTGLVGYLSFLDQTDTNIVSNFHGPIGAVFKIALITHLILYIPGDFVIMRSSLWKLLDTDVTKQSDRSFIFTTLGLISSVTIIAIVLQVSLPDTDSLGIVVNLSGGVAGSVVYFLVPGLCAWKLFPEQERLRQLSIMVIGFGVAIMVLVMVSSVL